MNSNQFLHDNKELFKQIIINIVKETNIAESIIEKDYYVTLALKIIHEKEPNIIFKGGTSLSKCYKVIERFSEDIDLNYGLNKQRATVGERRKIANSILETADSLQLRCRNHTKDNIQTHRMFNSYIIDYPAQFRIPNNFVKIETGYFIPSFPIEIKKVSSIICDYLKSKSREDIIKKYDLSPFEIKTQTIERTFIDKIFAICDYYLEKEITGKDNIQKHSRHLYDIYKIYPLIEQDNNLKDLIQEVRTLRKDHKTCYSAQSDLSINEILTEIINKDIYKKDYQTITKPLLYENIAYEDTVNTLNEIISSNLFEERKEIDKQINYSNDISGNQEKILNDNGKVKNNKDKIK